MGCWVRKPGVVASLVIAILGVLVAAVYFFVLPGLSSARGEPPGLETNVATWLLRHSVPTADKHKVNPLGKDIADVTAGRDLFREKCESCHAYDGAGKTELGAGVYPRPPVLRTLVPSLSDGEIFFHIRNGIRNTAMPAWDMPDRQLWQLVAYVRHLPVVNSLDAQKASVRTPSIPPSAHYVGSASCQNCHEDIFARWSKTRMANVVRDPKVHPDAIIPDFAKSDPLLTFTKEDVALVYGSGWKQRYFRKVGNDYFPYPAQWDVTHKMWRPYHVTDGSDWWAPLYPDPGDNSKRPTGPLCDGCHSVGFNITNNAVAEWNVGCERCHGAGSAHVEHPTRDNILNAARMDYVHANDTCIQCHSQGQPVKNPIERKYYDWPVGYRVGLRLQDYWKLEDCTLGETTFYFFPDCTAHKNRMQGNDFAQSVMYRHGITCASCHDVHGTENYAQLRKPANQICLDCHGPSSANGPHTATLEQHTHHKDGSTGSQCVACHMPAIETEGVPGTFVHAHTFRFISPAMTDKYKMPNPCTSCHTDKSTAWAEDAMSRWPEGSPWSLR